MKWNCEHTEHSSLRVKEIIQLPVGRSDPTPDHEVWIIITLGSGLLCKIHVESHVD